MRTFAKENIFYLLAVKSSLDNIFVTEFPYQKFISVDVRATSAPKKLHEVGLQ